MTNDPAREFIPNSFQTPNILVDKLMPLLTPEEMVILIYAVRRILGFQDKINSRQAAISLSQFELTGLSRPRVVKALDKLAQYKVLVREGKADKKGQRWKLSYDRGVDWDGLAARKKETKETGSNRINRTKRSHSRTSTTTVPVSVTPPYQSLVRPCDTIKHNLLNTNSNTISVVSNETTAPPPISVPEKPIEQPAPEEKPADPKPEPLGTPNESPPGSDAPPTAEPPKADAPPVHIAIIDAYWAGIPDDLRPIGKPPYSRHCRVAAELRDAGMTPERVSKFMAAKYPGYRTWCHAHNMPAVMPLEFVKKYIRAWITEDEKKPVAAQVEEFMDNWCDGCQRIKSYCVCGKEKPKPVESVVVTCWEHARGILTVILPSAHRKLLSQIKPIEKRGDALVLEVNNPVFRDQLEMTLASKQFTDPIRLLSGGELTNFRVVVA